MKLHQVVNRATPVIYEKYDPTSWGDCNEINCTLALVLQSLGFSVEAVAGSVTLEIPLDPENEDESEEGIFDPRHLWLIVNGETVDAASQQFENHV